MKNVGDVYAITMTTGTMKDVNNAETIKILKIVII
jgi:hypothetical protein